MKFLKQSPQGTTLTIHAQPGAKKSEIVGLHGEALKVRITARPIEGEANEALILFFSKIFGISKSKILLKQGGQSRHKVIELQGIDPTAALETLVKLGILP